MNPESDLGVLIRGKDTQTPKRRKPSGNKGRDWSDAVTSQGIPTMPASS